MSGTDIAYAHTAFKHWTADSTVLYCTTVTAEERAAHEKWARSVSLTLDKVSPYAMSGTGIADIVHLPARCPERGQRASVHAMPGTGIAA
eukprot:638806-Rhodomonas_salina.2